MQEVVHALAGAIGIDPDLSYPGDAATALLRRLFLHDQ
jgi:hypothetical protein